MGDDESKIAEKYEALRDVMDEQVRRMWAAAEARLALEPSYAQGIDVGPSSTR